jgi:hypothetical protein
MDFMQWLNSLGDVLYEVMSWLIFYPITLWRTMTRPIEMMSYADRELLDRGDEQFEDTLNPPLFLVLSLLLTQAIDAALGGGTNPIVAQKTGLAGYINDDTRLLALRLVVFAMFPLIMAARMLRAKRIKLTRKALRGPFYAQCYACAPFALALGIGVSLAHTPVPDAALIGLVLAAGAIGAYLIAEARWFAVNLAQSFARGLLNALAAFAASCVASFALGALFVLR